MIKGRPPRLEQIFQTYAPPLFFITICTIRRQKIGDLEVTRPPLHLRPGKNATRNFVILNWRRFHLLMRFRIVSGRRHDERARST
jgi:hypothetical protein